jgi:hypothetical protein
MSFLDKLLGRDKPQSSDAPTQSVIVTPRRAEFDKGALNLFELRKGMWVRTMPRMEDPFGSLGIVTACNSDGFVEVTVCKPDGFTQMTLNEKDEAVPKVAKRHGSEIRQAYIEEIPESRRGDDVDALRALGYINQSEGA